MDGLDSLFVNGRVITPEGPLGGDVAVGVTDGTIAAIGTPASLPDADRVVDLDGRYLLPGVVDCHVHTRSPGDEHKEDWTTITRAAAAGGVTTLIAMPNTDPIVSTPDRLRRVYEIADRDALVDFQSYGVLTAENTAQVTPLAEAGAAGYKVFLGTTFGEIEPPNDGQLFDAMKEIAETGLRVGFHEENDDILSFYEAEAKAAGRNRALDHARSRPVVAEAEAVQRTTLFSEHTGCPVHMFHLSSGTAAEIVARGKARGVNVSAETCPHYLWFDEDVYAEKGNAARVQPPIRSTAERDRLWEVGIDGDGVDCVATDHAPHTDEEKGLSDPFGNTWESISGFVGVETEVPAMATFVDEGRLSLGEWVRLHCVRPAKLWGIYPQKGSLEVGTDADFTVVDPAVEWTLDRRSLHSKSTATPFDGARFRGRATMTVVRGSVVYADGEVLADPGDGERVPVGETVDASALE
jgi:dihydroorotase/allantoinase